MNISYGNSKNKLVIIFYFRFQTIYFQTLSQKLRKEMTDSEINKVYNHILNQIGKIYDQYDLKSRQMKEQNNKKTGSTIDKIESDLMKKIQSVLEPDLQKLTNQMEKVKSLKGRYSGHVKNCHNSIKNILKRRSFNFKVNKQFNELYDQTVNAIRIVREKIPVAEQTAFLCCGVDGKKEFEAVINVFRIQSGKWQMIETLESKGSVDNFIAPEFNQNEYDFIKQILKSNWPKEKQAQVQVTVKEVPVTVQKVIEKKIYVEGQKSPLDQANQYLYGINREENPLFGLGVYHKQADQSNNADACAFLAKVYEQGSILPKNLQKAAGYYKKAMDSKHKYASYRYSMSLIRGTFSKDRQDKSKRPEQIKRALNILNEISAGQEPCPEALAQLGSLYQHGYFCEDPDRVQVVGIDLKKAISYNEKGRTLNLPRAMNNLGLIFYNNKDLNPSNPNQKVDSEQTKIENTKKALNYFFEAQKCGYPQAYYNLGIIHKQEKQPEKAIQYFYEGGRKGDYLSKIKFAYELMNQTSIQKQQFEDHYRLAEQWLEEVIHHLTILEAQGGSSDIVKKYSTEKAQAMFYMGLMYEHGFGVEKSPKRSFNYFLQASQTPYGPAKNKIGDCYFSGYAVPANRQLAIGCYLEAASLGDSDSMVNLGTIYLNGIPGVVQRNYSKAHEHFCKAMELQNSDAMIHLSYMYRNGLGLDSDDQLAKKLLQEAAKNKNSTALYMLKQRGEDFNKNIYYDNLENEFFSPPKRINISDIVPVISAIN